MSDVNDNELVRAFAREKSEAAFAALVRQHVNLVFATALRQIGDRAAAEEIAQTVFVALAQSAGKLGSHPTIAGWLHQTALNKSREWLRSELRRRRREEIAVSLAEARAEGDSVWSPLVPLLDEALLQLRDADRAAVIMHFMEGRTFQEVGSVLGVGEDTARKRVDRCLEQLTKFFRRQGFTVPTLSATAPLFALASHTAPTGLAATATAAGVANHSGTTLTLKGALKIMAWSKMKTAVVAGVAVLLAAGTTTITVKEIKAHQTQLWQKGFDLLVTDKVPSQTTILPSLASQSHHASGSHNGKMLGVGQSIQDMVMSAYGIHKAQINFPSSLPEGNYDFISNLPRNQAEALQQELQRKFGLAGHQELIATDHLILKVKSRNAPGLRRASLPFSGSEQDDSYSGHNQSSWSLVDYLADHLGTVVIDQTGLAGNFDIDFTWDKTPEGLKQALLEQTGLELVPSKEPIEILVVEDVNHPVVGIGAALAVDEQTHQLKITSVYPNSPAAEAGLSVGSTIQKIDGISVADKSLAQCVSMIRGQAGTKVQLEIITADGNTNAVELTRRKIQL